MKVRIDTYTQDQEAAIKVFGMICEASKKDSVSLNFEPSDGGSYNIMGEISTGVRLIAIANFVDEGPFNDDLYDLMNS